MLPINFDNIMIFLHDACTGFADFWRIINSKLSDIAPSVSAVIGADLTLLQLMVGSAIATFITLSIIKWVLGIVT